MDASPLKKLPPELRNRIYERVLSRPNGVQVRMKGDEPRAYYSSRALAATCRAVRSEALGIFWSINDFHITTHHFQFCTTSNPVFGKPIKCQDGPFAKIREWVNAVGDASAGHLSHVCLELGLYDNDIPQLLPFRRCSNELLALTTASGLPMGSLHVVFDLRYSYTYPRRGDRRQKVMHLMLPLSNMIDTIRCIDQPEAMEEARFVAEGSATTDIVQLFTSAVTTAQRDLDWWASHLRSVVAGG